LCDFAARVVDVTVVVPTAYLEQGHIKDKMLVNVLGGGKNVNSCAILDVVVVSETSSKAP